MTTQTAAQTLEDITSAFFLRLKEKRVEPEQRLVGGRFGYAIHRFPIKGGITMGEVMADSITRSNSLLRLLQSRPK